MSNLSRGDIPNQNPCAIGHGEFFAVGRKSQIECVALARRTKGDLVIRLQVQENNTIIGVTKGQASSVWREGEASSKVHSQVELISGNRANHFESGDIYKDDFVVVGNGASVSFS